MMKSAIATWPGIRFPTPATAPTRITASRPRKISTSTSPSTSMAVKREPRSASS